ncbi:MAG: class I SAM-dependent methyltransferase [Marmoricola sp.]
MVAEHDDLAAYFDQWYADMGVASAADAIQQRHLGLPPELLSTSLLSWDAVGEVEQILALPAGGTLVDLACGRGGYGLELAARAGARVIGIDFAPTALDAARSLAAARSVPADFRVGDLVATGLPDAVADGVIVVDAIQFPTDPPAAYREIRRILVPGCRVVLTGWEAVARADERVPERIRNTDLAGGLAEAGFAEVAVVERTDWREVERAMWTEAAALDPGDDPALKSFHDEGVRAVETFDLLRRVLATAIA